MPLARDNDSLQYGRNDQELIFVAYDQARGHYDAAVPVDIDGAGDGGGPAIRPSQQFGAALRIRDRCVAVCVCQCVCGSGNVAVRGSAWQLVRAHGGACVVTVTVVRASQ